MAANDRTSEVVVSDGEVQLSAIRDAPTAATQLWQVRTGRAWDPPAGLQWQPFVS